MARSATLVSIIDDVLVMLASMLLFTPAIMKRLGIGKDA